MPRRLNITSARMIERIAERDGDMRCVWCGEIKPLDQIGCDHLRAWSNDGSNHIDNLVISCRDCNNDKSVMRPEQYMRKAKNPQLDILIPAMARQRYDSVRRSRCNGYPPSCRTCGRALSLVVAKTKSGVQLGCRICDRVTA